MKKIILALFYSIFSKKNKGKYHKQLVDYPKDIIYFKDNDNKKEYIDFPIKKI